MRHSQPIILIFLVSILFDKPLFAQTDSYSILSINNFIRKTDSLIEKDNNQKFIVIGIAEGEIYKKPLATEIIGDTNRIDPVRSKISGAWSAYSYENPKHDTLYKIEYHDNLEKDFYLTFYYENNKLVF